MKLIRMTANEVKADIEWRYGVDANIDSDILEVYYAADKYGRRISAYLGRRLKGNKYEIMIGNVAETVTKEVMMDKLMILAK